MSAASALEHRPIDGRPVGLNRRLVAVHLTATVVDGVVLSSIVLHAVTRLGLQPTTVGAVLAGAAVVALVTAPAAGAAADQFGLPPAIAGFGAVTAVALLGYLTAGSVVAFAAAAVLFVSAQAGGGSARQALAVIGVSDRDRVRTRAKMHTLLNAGLGFGTALGAGVVAIGSPVAFTVTYLAAAVAVAVASLAARQVNGGVAAAVAHRPSPGGVLLPFRDRRFAAATALACFVQLTMPILSVLLPILVLHSHAPRWTAAAALALNTVIVIMIQSRWTTRLVDARSTARSALVAALALIIAGALLASVTAAHSSGEAALIVLAAVSALTLGEVSGGAAVWRVALTIVPTHAEGRYQAAFSMSSSGARILGPLAALPLVLATGAAGWLILTGVMATACLLVALLGQGSRHDITVPSTNR